MSSMTLFFIIVCVIAVLFLIINFWIAPHNPYDVKMSPFECGFSSFQQTRSPIEIGFFRYGILFLLIDLEVLVGLPGVLSLSLVNMYGLLSFLMFNVAVLVGFLFELAKGALDMSSRQKEYSFIGNVPKLRNGIFSFFTYSKSRFLLNKPLKSLLGLESLLGLKNAMVPLKLVLMSSKVNNESKYTKYFKSKFLRRSRSRSRNRSPKNIERDNIKSKFDFEKILTLTDYLYFVKKNWIKKYVLIILYTLMILFITSLFINLFIYKYDLSFGDNIKTIVSALSLACLMYKNRNLSIELSISSLYLIINISILSLILAIFIYNVTNLLDYKSFILSFKDSFNLSKQLLGILLTLKLTISLVKMIYEFRKNPKELVKKLALLLLSLVVLSFFYKVIFIISTSLVLINDSYFKDKISNVESKSKIEDKSLNHHFSKKYPWVKKSKGIYIEAEDGRQVLDAASGAAVSSIGHGNPQVGEAMMKKISTGVSYVSSAYWKDPDTTKLQDNIIEELDGKMGENPRVYLTGSGSDAVEAALKLSSQYYYEQDNETTRTIYISREQSYHGNTLGALSISDFPARQEPYRGILLKDNVEHISSCYTYRQQLEGESDAEFIAKKAAELENKILEKGPENIIAFFLEPVSGAALGCASPPFGYLRAMSDVCSKYDILIVFDEIMCGSGRTGNMYAWQEEGVAPDILIIGKGLGAGYQPIAGVVASEKVWGKLKTEQFIHGHTFDALPLAAVAANEVQDIIKEKNLLENVKIQGDYLKESLRKNLIDHPNVGDIRGKGLFIGVEFVKDSVTKEPFDPKLGVSEKIVELAKSPKFNVVFYGGKGTVDGIRGDHIIIAPPYTIGKEDVDHIVKVLSDVIERVFKEINQ